MYLSLAKFIPNHHCTMKACNILSPFSASWEAPEWGCVTLHSWCVQWSLEYFIYRPVFISDLIRCLNIQIYFHFRLCNLVLFVFRWTIFATRILPLESRILYSRKWRFYTRISNFVFKEAPINFNKPSCWTTFSCQIGSLERSASTNILHYNSVNFKPI